MKFQIARSPTFAPLLALFSATRGRSFINVEPDEIEIRFGFTHQRIPRSEIRSVSLQKERPWYARSIGWRTNLKGGVSLVGTSFNLVKIEHALPRKIFVGISVLASEIIVSLEHPTQFVAALHA